MLYPLSYGGQLSFSMLASRPLVSPVGTVDRRATSVKWDAWQHAAFYYDAEVVRKIALEEKLTLCDVHEAFVERLAKVNEENKHAGNLTYDGVHMNQAGNDLLADRVADGIRRALRK